MLYPKHEYIRSKKLLENCRRLSCQHCGTDDGTVVAAHTNWGHGKSMGRKADDNRIAALCFNCHAMIDQGSKLSREDRQKIWTDAHIKTVYKLVLLGLWDTSVPVPIPLKSDNQDA